MTRQRLPGDRQTEWREIYKARGSKASRILETSATGSSLTTTAQALPRPLPRLPLGEFYAAGVAPRKPCHPPPPVFLAAFAPYTTCRLGRIVASYRPIPCEFYLLLQSLLTQPECLA